MKNTGNQGAGAQAQKYPPKMVIEQDQYVKCKTNKKSKTDKKIEFPYSKKPQHSNVIEIPKKKNTKLW